MTEDEEARERIRKKLQAIDKKVEEKFGPKEDWYCTRVERDKMNEKKLQERIQKALDIIAEDGSTDGADHKQWVMDQVVRALAPDYEEWVRVHNYGDEGPETYLWEEGTVP